LGRQARGGFRIGIRITDQDALERQCGRQLQCVLHALCARAEQRQGLRIGARQPLCGQHGAGRSAQPRDGASVERSQRASVNRRKQQDDKGELTGDRCVNLGAGYLLIRDYRAQRRKLHTAGLRADAFLHGGLPAAKAAEGVEHRGLRIGGRDMAIDQGVGDMEHRGVLFVFRYTVYTMLQKALAPFHEIRRRRTGAKCAYSVRWSGSQPLFGDFPRRGNFCLCQRICGI
jgi:hypothetical protein